MKEMQVSPIDIDPTLALATQIVVAYVGKNAVDHEDLPRLIRDVRAALAGAVALPMPVEQPLVPAVNPKKSVFRDHLVCLEDGQRMKVLRRHLQAAHGMTPDQYRQRWGLSADYPMTAPDYAAKRSELAKDFGLGRKPAGAPQPSDGGATGSVPSRDAAREPGDAAALAQPAVPTARAPQPGKRKPRTRTQQAAPLRRRGPRAKR